MTSAAETFRAREVYKYYQPNDILQLSEAPSHLPAPATNFNTQQSFSDTALTAFTQLIALRLSAQRAIVSLLDHENEYFLAESTSTLSLFDDGASAQNAFVSISGARVPREASLCEQTLRLVPNQDTTAEKTPVFLVPDLLLDEKMSKLDCVKGPPHLRFYCGVALTNKTGTKLGCVYVVDDRPRSDFSLEEAQFLTRMAATVMDHLENIRAKEDIVRMTRMSQALHAFIEGEGTMDGDWQRMRKYNLPSNAGVEFSWQSRKNDGPTDYIKGEKELVLPSASNHLEVPTNHGQSPLQHTGINSDARFNFNNSPWSSTSEVPQIPILKSVFEGLNEAAAKLTNGRDAEFANDGFSNLLHDTFSRASNLVREGMEIDGAVFFDAPFRFYQGRSTLETDPRRIEDKGVSSDSDDEHDARPGPRPQVLRSETHVKIPELIPIDEALKSDILGFSTHGSSSWDKHARGSKMNFTAIDQSLLTLLVRRYPQGELFVFDENGPVSPPNDILLEGSQLNIESASVRAKFERHKARKRAEILRLLVAFPNARQIFFVPLYDSTSGCFIGSFTWSNSATRIFSAENHLSYLIAFGHSVMSEVSRLNTLSADRAKGDFISNVSHELRSPLHGILASVEFLADTALDGFQRNLVDTVDMCGRTLLDTIEHVLDFSKIKKYKSGVESSQPMGVVANLDISAVIEEVLEGVFAGFEFNGLSSQGLADTTQSSVRDMPEKAKAAALLRSAKLKDQLTVILDIDFRNNWKFPTVPGTWRRLTMNLFGNSLKYTQDGYITVKLEARNISDSTDVKSHDIGKTLVTMTISDTGRGMSTEFMETKLFTPFSQEDGTAPGTGLGMSMVKQIVDLSGGKMDVQSELGKGTEIKLSLPLQNSTSDADKILGDSDPLYAENPINAVRRRTKGRKVAIRGFDNTIAKTSIQKAASDALKASIKKYITEWFNLTLVSGSDVANIVISDESYFLRPTESLTSKPELLLILCSNGTRRDLYSSRTSFAQHVEFVSKPCGPHRLAKALLNCLDKEDATKQSNVARGSIEFSPTATNLNIVPPAQSNDQPSLVPRLPLVQRMSSGNGLSKSKSTTRDSTPLESPSTSNNAEMSPGISFNDVNVISDPVSITEGVALRPLKMLLVEDNPINMMLLATYMKKNKWDYETAENGLLALEAFQNRPQGYDIIFMDVSMPIMTGYEATLAIRNVETERRLADESQSRSPSPPVTRSRPSTSYPFPIEGTATAHTENKVSGARDPRPHHHPALIIALTGFSSKKDQEQAFESGVDVFMTKPVRFREVGRILEGWTKNREREMQQANDAVSIGHKEKRELDEDMPGVERSG